MESFQREHFQEALVEVLQIHLMRDAPLKFLRHERLGASASGEKPWEAAACAFGSFVAATF